MKKIALLILIFVSLAISSLAQKGFIVKGTIIDGNDKMPLPGVNVILKGTSKGVSTDIDGKFKIYVNSSKDVLKISFMGYKPQNLFIGNKKEFKISLQPDAKSLKEVVVLGYGTVKSKESVVGSVEQVKSDVLAVRKADESVDKMLEGVIAGVQVEATGDPGSPVSVRIRGQGSVPGGNAAIVASSEPLYVLDGIPLTDVGESNSSTLATDMSINPLAYINPEDIESVTVLKDASAAAIYGANAANGVILITTKKGRKGKTRVTVNYKHSFQQPKDKIKYLNTDQYIELVKESYAGSNLSDYKGLIENPDVYTDWQDLVLQTGQISSTNVSLSGGNDSSVFRMSFGYNKNKTTVIGNDFETYTARFNYTNELYKGWKLTYTGGFSKANKDISASAGSLSQRPNLPVYNQDGSYYRFPDGYIANPLAALDQNQNWTNDFNTTNRLKLGVNLIKNVKWTSQFGYNQTNSRGRVYYSPLNSQGHKVNGFISSRTKNSTEWTAFTQLEYNNRFENHGLTVLAGTQASKREINNIRTTDKDLLTDKIILPGAGNDEKERHSGTESTTTARSFYGRVNYDYLNKYFLSVNLRSDESSYFGGDSKVELFSSIGASWAIYKEGFLADSKIIQNAKLKASFGKLGNAKVGSYSARGLYSYSQTAGYNGTIVATSGAGANPDLSWQKTYKLNVGLEFTLFNKLKFLVEYYRNDIIDAIRSIDVTPEFGYNNVSVNAIDMRNTGVEISLSSKSIFLGDFKFNSGFNIAFNKNKITDIDDRVTLPNLIEGESSTLILGYEYLGVNSQNGNPMYRLANGAVTENTKDLDYQVDKMIIGDSAPDFTGGFNQSITYKSFSLSLGFTFEYGADFMLPYGSRMTERSDQLYIKNQSVNLLDRWQKPGDQTNIPKVSKDKNSIYLTNTTQFMYDKTNISFRNLSFDYILPIKVAKKLNLSQFKVGFGMSNIYTWYKDGAKDGRNGIAEYRYTFPKSRIYTFNVSLSY